MDTRRDAREMMATSAYTSDAWASLGAAAPPDPADRGLQIRRLVPSRAGRALRPGLALRRHDRGLEGAGRLSLRAGRPGLADRAARQRERASRLPQFLPPSRHEAARGAGQSQPGDHLLLSQLELRFLGAPGTASPWSAINSPASTNPATGCTPPRSRPGRTWSSSTPIPMPSHSRTGWPTFRKNWGRSSRGSSSPTTPRRSSKYPTCSTAFAPTGRSSPRISSTGTICRCCHSVSLGDGDFMGQKWKPCRPSPSVLSAAQIGHHARQADALPPVVAGIPAKFRRLVPVAVPQYRALPDGRRPGAPST